MTITSQHNPPSSNCVASRASPSASAAAGSRPRARIWLPRPREAGWRALEGYRLAGSGLGGEGFVDVDAQALARGLDAGLGHARDRRLRAALGAGARGTAVRVPARRRRPWERRRGAALGAGVRRERRGARPGLRRSVWAEGRAGEHGRDLRGGARAGGVGRGAAGRAGRARRPRGRGVERASPRSSAGDVTLLVGAEREGLPEEIVAACERTAQIPIAADSLNAAMAATVALYEMTRQANRLAAK